MISLNHKSSYEPSGNQIIGHPIMFVGLYAGGGDKYFFQLWKSGNQQRTQPSPSSSRHPPPRTFQSSISSSGLNHLLPEAYSNITCPPNLLHHLRSTCCMWTVVDIFSDLISRRYTGISVSSDSDYCLTPLADCRLHVASSAVRHSSHVCSSNNFMW